jgi:hypothetical protein
MGRYRVGQGRQVGQKWPKMAKNGQKWPKMAKNGQKTWDVINGRSLSKNHVSGNLVIL